MNPLETLKLRYDEILKSPSEPLFYYNVYKYIDLIVKTPELVEVIDKSAEEYSTKHHTIHEPRSLNNREDDEKEEQVHTLERGSLYASDFAFLYGRIYAYIEEYKNPEHGEPPTPEAIAMLRGTDTLETKAWPKETREHCSRWYFNKQKEYEEKLKKFHLHFLTTLTKQEGEKAVLPKKKIPLTLHPRTGGFTFYEIEGNFSPATPEFKVLSTLYNDKDYYASYLSLIQSYRPDTTEVSKSQKDDLFIIMRKIKEKLGILPETEASNPDIFQNIKNVGYRLVSEAPDETPE